MKVILNKDIPNLGEEGDVKDVARGYARNLLIPRKLVMPYNRQSMAILESRREYLAKRREEKRKDAMDIKTRLESERLVLEMPAGDRGRLFGSVTSATIADALASMGISVERKRIEIPDKTIKAVGTTRVRIRLYGDEEAELRVVVKGAGGETASARGSTRPASATMAAPTEEAAAAGVAADDGGTASGVAVPAQEAEPARDDSEGN